MRFSEKKNRESGSAWRQANNAFFKSVSRSLTADTVVLDVGAGHGYLRSYFDCTYLATDVYPYDGLDFLCDLAITSPLRPASVDVVLLNNVMEHLPQPDKTLKAAASALRRGGKVAIAVPFIIKVHQAPYDFLRYTHLMLRRLLEHEGFEDIGIEAVYTPGALHRVFLNEMFAAYPSSAWWQRIVSRSTRFMTWRMIRLSDWLIRPPSSVTVRIDASSQNSLNPWLTGYHVVASKI
jgi:SAM-dependent methyltransferase